MLGPEVMDMVMEATSAGITVTDPSRPDNPLVYCNRAFLEMTGYPAGELLGRNMRLLQGPDTDPAAVRDIRAGIGRGTPVAVEILNYRKDGTPFWNALTVRPIHGPDGAVRWHVGSAIDVTRQRRSEQELRDAQEQLTRLAAETFALAEDLDRAREEADAARVAAENASTAKSRFLAMMSHELRTPMTAVIGMGDLLLGTPLTDQQKSFVKTLRSSADTLLAILNDILDFSKIEAGQLALEEIDFSLERLVEDAVQLFLVRAAAKGLTLSASIADGTPAFVRGDPTRLRQVLFNLVSNAIKFTEHGAVEVCVWSPEEDESGITLRFEVSDTGIGLTPDQQSRLFEAFVQADVSTNRKYGGTGLGLAICKRLVQAMGGEIGVTSEPGRGSAFRFSIRARPAQATPTGDLMVRPPVETLALIGAGSGKAPTRSLRVLLAEDNDINRMLVSTMLTRMGHRVESVADGRAALQALEGGAFDLLLLDMEMPVMDGGTTARAIRAAPGPLAQLPIIGLSADALPEHRDRHMAAGLDAYMTKPIEWDALGALMLDLAGRPPETRRAPAPAPAAGPGRFAHLPLVDRVKLSELRVALGAESLAGMLRLMPETCLRELTAIRNAQQAARPADIKQAAHTLAGLAANFGTPRLAAVARAINDHHTDAAEVAALLPQLEAAVADTNRLIAAPDAVLPLE
ncbi:MAG TPA: ATP-binding protein [Azospirillum sp.]